MNFGRMATFKTLPVEMKVRADDSGSCAKPETACCAATQAFSMLTVASRLKSSREIAKGSSAGVKVTELTVICESGSSGTARGESYHCIRQH